ncbi:outer membrane beta-barrel protein [Desulfobacterales bacterium HSG17]|nr:outer membrane beta-barrel protein [Desulfobacterales bacterium HSG17]
MQSINKQNRRIPCICIIAIFITIIFAVKGIAAERIFLAPLSVESDSNGKLRITPTFSVNARSDSNFYKDNVNERQVYTYVIQPGIKMAYETAKSSVRLGYTLDAHYYKDGDDVPEKGPDSNDKNFIGHSLDFSMKTTPVSKLTLELKEKFRKTRDQSESDSFAVDEEKDKYSINTLTPGLFYRFNERFATGLKYQNTIQSYNNGSTEDYIEHKGIFDFLYYFSPTASLDMEYQRWKRIYDVDMSDYMSDKISLFFRKQGKYLGFEVGGGYHKRDFDNEANEDTDTFSYLAAFSWRYSNTYARLSFEEDFNSSGLADSFYRARQIAFKAGRIFMDRLSTDLNGYYRLSDYEYSDREDDTFGIAASIGYKFKEWMSVKLTGGYDKRDSVYDENDYDNTYVMVGFDSTYDVGKQ